MGGIPLLYLGDELGALNDYAYRDDPAKVGDSRWVHRPRFDWRRAGRRHDPATIEGRLWSGLRRLIAIRQGTPDFAGVATEVIDPGNDHIFGYVRRGTGAGGRVLALANVTEREQPVDANYLRLHGLAYAFTDLVTGATVTLDRALTLAPYQFVWLTARD